MHAQTNSKRNRLGIDYLIETGSLLAHLKHLIYSVGCCQDIETR